MFKKELNKNDLKSFLYNFFIIWNSFLILFLIILNIYLPPSNLKNNLSLPAEICKIKQKWINKKNFQNIGENIFAISLYKSDNKFKNLITCSSNGFLSSLDCKNGFAIFIQNLNYIKNFFIFKNKAILVSNNEMLLAFDNSGKKIKELKLEGKINNINSFVSNKKYFIILSDNKNLYLIKDENKQVKSFWLKNFFRKQVSSNNLKIFKKIEFELPIITEISLVDLNNDKIDDIIIGDLEKVFALDGLTFNILWEQKLNYLYSGKISILKNKQDIYILIPFYNGNILILNKSGISAGSININSKIVEKPIIFKQNKKFFILQKTTDNKLFCYEFNTLTKKFEKQFPEDFKVAIGDLNYNGIPDIIIISESGMLNIIENEKELYKFNIMNDKTDRITSNILIDDIDNDLNYEIIFGTAKGNVYVFTFITEKSFFRKILTFKYNWVEYASGE